MAAQLGAPVPSSSFPIVFFDGDREIDVGPLRVLPSLGFKRFLTAVSQRIGVSSHQISISLVRRKKARPSRDVRRKVPIDETTDLAALARERDCFVLAVLRRSRRERRGRSRRKGRAEQQSDLDPDEENGDGAGPEVTILRRRGGAGPEGVDTARAGWMVPGEAAGMGMWDCEGRMRRILLCQREGYPISGAAAAAAAAPGYRPIPPPAACGDCEAAAPGYRPIPPPAACGDCEAANAEGRSPGFHWCVHDAITFGFRSPVGPIQRPSKERAEASDLLCG